MGSFFIELELFKLELMMIGEVIVKQRELCKIWMVFCYSGQFKLTMWSGGI